MNFLPLPDGRYLLTGEGRTKSEIAKFSAADADRYDRLCRRTLGRGGRAQRSDPEAAAECGEGTWASAACASWRAPRPSATAFANSISSNSASLSISSPCRLRTSCRGGSRSEPLQALLGFNSIVGTYASPFDPGTAYVLLHHAFGEVNGKKGAWGHAIGGMGAITQAMAKAAIEAGAEIETSAEVEEVLIETRQCGGRRVEGWPRRARPRARRKSQSEAALYAIAAGVVFAIRLSDEDASVQMRLGHVPDERGPCRSCRASRHCRERSRKPITAPASSSGRASVTWTRPIAMRGSGAGAESR